MTNKVMFLKMCWKLITYPDNIASQIMRHKYIVRRAMPTSFKKGSYMWKGLGNIWDWFKTTSKWIPGNGSSISFWDDIWVGDKPLRHCVYGPLPYQEDSLTVKDCILDFKWEVPPLSIDLPSTIKRQIMATPIPNLHQQDVVVSTLAKNNRFQFKLAYLALGHPNLVDQPEIGAVWGASTLPKIRFFLWLCWHDRLPSNQTLANRLIINSNSCPFCPQFPENAYHILFSCVRAREVWNKLLQAPANPNQNIKDCLTLNLGHTTETNSMPWSVLFPFTVWQLWKRRNAWIFNRDNITVVACLKSSTFAAWEWLSNQPTPCTHINQTQLLTTIHVWLPPTPGFIKINVDASWDTLSWITGIAMVARDHTGQWVMGAQMKVLSPSALVAEILAIRLALTVAKREDW